MKDYEFKVGDLVRIRSWDDMAKKYPMCGDLAISIGRIRFIERMKYLCGREFVIQEIRPDEGSGEPNYGYGAPECSGTDEDDSEPEYWIITPGMIELVDEEASHRDDAVTQDDLMSVLIGA